MARVILILIVLYIVYQWFLKPLLNKYFSGTSRGNQDAPRVDRTPEHRDLKGGEYIDYEEVKEEERKRST